MNNAALQGRGPLEDFPLDRFHATMDTNTYGPLRVAQALTPAWRERGSGIFVNVSSVQGRVATPLEGAYAASKYALEAISETLHYELAHFGIRVVIIQPGYIAPGMKRGTNHDGPAAYGPLWEQWDGTDTKVTGTGWPTGAGDRRHRHRGRDRRPGAAAADPGGRGRRDDPRDPSEPRRRGVRSHDAQGARLRPGDAGYSGRCGLPVDRHVTDLGGVLPEPAPRVLAHTARS